MSGWTAHNITHSSASSINMYANAPCVWVAKYLLGRKFNFSHAARAGVLAEAAVVNVIANGRSVDDETAAAIKEFGKAIAIHGTDADRKRGEAIPGMIEHALKELAPYGEPEWDGGTIEGRKQKKIELLCKTDDWQLPVIGLLDFWFPKHGLVVDLKTSMRLPSEMSDEHLRQGAIYRAATGNSTVKFLYVTGKGAKWHEVEDHVPVLQGVKALLCRQERFLALGNAQTLQSVVPVQAGSYYWSDDAALRSELYGI